MPSTSNTNNPQGRNLLWQYAGLTAQLLVAIGLAVFLGMQLDKWLKWSIPVSTIILPMLVITSLIIKVIRDTSRKK